MRASVLETRQEKREQLISFLSKFVLHILTYIFLIGKLGKKLGKKLYIDQHDCL